MLIPALGVMLLAGCATTTPSSETPSPSPSTHVAAPSGHYEGLGDSVPAGTNCGCTPFPELTSTEAGQANGQSVSVSNDAVPGYTTKQLLSQLDTSQAVIENVTRSNVVEVEIGANDVAYNSTCGTDAACYETKVQSVQANLTSIVNRLRQLAPTHSTLILLDYWSVWLGGKYAAAKGQPYVDAAAKVTDSVNTVIKDEAHRTGAKYVDLRAAFKGPNYSYDETHYLSNDGDHPNAAGHARIADAVMQVLTSAS